MTKPTTGRTGSARAGKNSSADFSAGRLLNERYRIVSVIGRGGVATVYRAQDESLGRTVALKVISRSLGDADDTKRRAKEVRLIAGFHHPGLVTLFDFVPIDGGPEAMLVMQCVEGADLASRIAGGPLAPELTAEIGAAIAAALAHVHNGGVMHRDVKPANILLPTEGVSAAQVAVLADFGIARLVDESNLTSTGLIVGTASYLSPEQAHGAALAPSTDIYSLGLVLLECLTGVRAFPGTALESVAARLSADPTIPESVGAVWAPLLRSMLDRDAAARPSAAEVERTLSGMASSGMASQTGNETTKLMPASAAVATAATEVLSPAATEVLVPSAQEATAASPAPRAPRQRPAAGAIPLGKIALVAGVVIALFVILLLAVFAVLQLRSLSASLPTASPAASSSATPTAITYPAVEGKLGEHLVDLQRSVAAVESDSTSAELGSLVLALTELSAQGDYNAALGALDDLQDAVDAASLTSTERSQIQTAIDDVRADLEDLSHTKPGNGGGKPGKG